MLQKKILPIAMAVSACFIAGTSVAVASDLEISGDTPYTEDILIDGTSYSNLKNLGVITNNSVKMTNFGQFLNQNGTITTKVIDINVCQANEISGVIKAFEKFVYRGASGNNLGQKLSAIVTTPLLEIIGKNTSTDFQTGLEVQSQEVIDHIDAIRVESNIGRTTLSFKDGNFQYNGTITLTDNTAEGTGDARVEANNGATVNLNSVITENGKSNIQATNSSTISVGDLTVKENAKLTIAGWGDAHSNGTINLNEVYLEKGAKLTGMDHAPDAHALKITGDIFLTLEADAVADFVRPESKGEASFDANSLNVTVLDSHSDSKVLLSEGKTSTKNITVTGAPSSNTGNSVNDLEALSQTVQYVVKGPEDPNGKDPELTDIKNIEGVEIVQEASDIYDGASATVGKNGLENITTYANQNVYGITEMTALGLQVWRNEINDMNKRLGELRDSSAQSNGVWARVYNGKSRIGSLGIKNKYTALQMGYDHQIDRGVWLGGAASYTFADNDFRNGDGDSALYAFTGYGSWLADNGMFLDVTGKIGRMKNTFDISSASGTSSGDYHTNTVSASVEAGWRFPMGEMFFIEPQAELMWGHVSGVKYTTSVGVNVDQDATDAFVGRAGVVLGLKCPNNGGNAYVRASVLHDWKGESKFAFSQGTESRSMKEDLGGTWYEFGLGANFNINEQTHVYGDVETTHGGEVVEDYRVNVGIRYAW